MKVYAESSAVLSWVLDERRGGAAFEILERASLVFASTLTLIECSRAIHRLVGLGELRADAADALASDLRAMAEQWVRLDIGERVVARASGPFPVEPVRSLDAIHVASALLVHEASGPIAMLSFDERVRSNAAALGLTVLPKKA